MCKGFCDNCKYAEWDVTATDRGVYHFISGCTLWENPEKYEAREKELIADGIEIDTTTEENWGDSVECPLWEEARCEDDYT